MIRKTIIVLAVSLAIFSVNSNVWAISELDRVDISGTRLVNAFGAPVSELVNVNQQVQISSDISNNQEKSQKFVYIIQVKDEDGIVVSLGWFSGMLSPFQSLSPALSWTSKTAGTFNVEIFVWERLLNHSALTEHTVFTITVS